MIEKLNHQKDVGPLEDLHAMIAEAGYPQKMLISIGATRYTEFGETHYLQRGDKLYVVVYPHGDYSHEDITIMIEKEAYPKGLSVLVQEVV